MALFSSRRGKVNVEMLCNACVAERWRKVFLFVLYPAHGPAPWATRRALNLSQLPLCPQRYRFKLSWYSSGTSPVMKFHGAFSFLSVPFLETTPLFCRNMKWLFCTSRQSNYCSHQEHSKYPKVTLYGLKFVKEPGRFSVTYALEAC